MNFRVGHGYDVHRLVPDRKLWLGGVLIPHDKGLQGHSDADVLIHAICDALLGAIAAGDIGKHFPDTDEKYRNIDSKTLLQRVKQMVEDDGWAIANIDATLVMEKPRVAGYIEDMRMTLADILDTEIRNVSVKATTTEGMGFEGMEEGISAHAVSLIYKV
ncbi:MAG: 2-C-methyl-D-erythritol 2,4-cyclodiphosphate synthase [Bacteroidota bacterium]